MENIRERDIRYCHGVGWIVAELKHKRKHEEES
jgi:hypothetical protein